MLGESREEMKYGSRYEDANEKMIDTQRLQESLPLGSRGTFVSWQYHHPLSTYPPALSSPPLPTPPTLPSAD